MASNTFGPVFGLNAVTATGAGSAIDLIRIEREEINNLGVWSSTTGTPATVSIQIEASPDDSITAPTNWFPVGSAITATTNTGTILTLPPGTRWMRANLTTLTGGTAPTVTVKLAIQTDD